MGNKPFVIVVTRSSQGHLCVCMNLSDVNTSKKRCIYPQWGVGASQGRIQGGPGGQDPPPPPFGGPPKQNS